MATPDRAGWFDDPDHPEQLRYFDGILWTDHVTPRRTHSGVVPPASASDASAPSPVGSPANPYAAQPGSHPTNPYAAGPAPAVPTAYRPGPTTTDGVPLASYGQRVLAYVIDWAITWVLGVILGGWFLWQAVAPVREGFGAAVASGDPDRINEVMAQVDMRSLAVYTAIALVVTLAYHLFFLSRWSATPGKMALSISVRRVTRQGVVDFPAASRRVAFVILLSALSNLPLVNLIALAATVADLLWPLSDKRRQTLHDKVADTVVVRGKQTRRKS